MALRHDRNIVVENVEFTKQREWMDCVLDWAKKYPLNYSVLEVNGSPQTSMFGSLGSQLSVIAQYSEKSCV